MGPTAAVVAGSRSGEATEQASRPARILVAEDDSDMRALVARALRLDGYEVFETASGQALLQTMRSVFIDTWPVDGIELVLCDLRMPGLSGLDVARMLRANRWNMPILLMTAFVDPAVVEEARRLDVAVIHKPFTLQELNAAARQALAQRQPPPAPTSETKAR